MIVNFSELNSIFHFDKDINVKLDFRMFDGNRILFPATIENLKILILQDNIYKDTILPARDNWILYTESSEFEFEFEYNIENGILVSQNKELYSRRLNFNLMDIIIYKNITFIGTRIYLVSHFDKSNLFPISNHIGNYFYLLFFPDHVVFNNLIVEFKLRYG
jgi:hypothetical protein